jgi:hypothetical protein
MVTQEGSSGISVVDPSGALWFYWQTIGSAEWNAELITGRDIGGVTSVAQVGNSVVIAATTTGGLMFYWETLGASEWHPETA